MLTVYHYPRCSTCKKALKWLEARGIEAKLIDIVASPPPRKVLAEALEASGLPVQKLFNTSGELYRAGNYKQRLANMSEAEALAELAQHGKLIKRPLLVGNGVALIGFREADYAKAFA
jgi:arsenate reductase (glutaredoxin)